MIKIKKNDLPQKILKILFVNNKSLATYPIYFSKWETTSRAPQNRFSLKYDQNRWKLPMKVFIYSKVTDWRPKNLLKVNSAQDTFQG